MPRPFLTAEWRNLFLATYAMPPSLLKPSLPPGLELDIRNGDAFVSLVAFQFVNTRVLGVPWPGYRDFPELNLRWIVERTFGWFNRYRRLSKDYEHNPKSSETWIYIAMIHRMPRFSLPDKNKDDDLLKRPPKRLKT